VEPAVSTPAEDAIGAALLKMTEYGERIGVLDEREAEHFRAVTSALHELRTKVNGVEGTIADQAEILGSLNGLDEAVAKLAEQITPLLPPAAPASDRYQPADTVRWWRLQDGARTEAIARLGNWVDQIYLPHYGYLAAPLGPCWESHPLCLVLFDWLSELWSVLYLSKPRTDRLLDAQAEFSTRIVPAVADQLRIETSTCGHGSGPPSRNGTPTSTTARTGGAR
jgi:hypothetical protein